MSAPLDIRIEPFALPPGLAARLAAIPPDTRLGRDRRIEAWLPAEPWAKELHKRMTGAARRFAAEVLGATAERNGGLAYNRYGPGDSCRVHIDQYTRRTHPGPETLHRTASASLIVERAEAGGAMMFQDFARLGPLREANPEAGNLILFPADWWHKVMPVAAGVRRSIVGWWASETGEPFRSGAGEHDA